MSLGFAFREDVFSGEKTEGEGGGLKPFGFYFFLASIGEFLWEGLFHKVCSSVFM